MTCVIYYFYFLMLLNIMMGKGLKRSVKKIDIDNLNTSDVLCPICRTILIEPVSLPCNHAFCKTCFDDTMLNANLQCPLCRIRVGSWFRRTLKAGKLINEQLWSAIKLRYAREVHNKYNGIDNAIEEVKPMIIISRPGEIRKEYEHQRKIDEQEQKKLKDAEELASGKLIQKLSEQEDTMKRVTQERIRLDVELAKKLSEEYRASSSSASSSASKQYLMSNNIKNNKKKIGPFERFLMSKHQGLKNLKNVINNSSGIQNRNNTSNNSNKMYNTDEKKGINTISLSHLHLYSQTHPQVKKVVVNDERNIRIGYLSADNRETSDVIDQEYKIYFKPIHSFKPYHLFSPPIPLVVKAIRHANNGINNITPPKGKTIDLSKGRSESAFAQYSRFHITEKQNSTVDGMFQLNNTDNDNLLSNNSKIIDFYKERFDYDDDFRGFAKASRQLAAKTCDNILKVCKELEECIEPLKIRNNLESEPFSESKNILTISEQSSHDISQGTTFNNNIQNMKITHTTHEEPSTSSSNQKMKLAISPVIETRFRRQQFLRRIERNTSILKNKSLLNSSKIPRKGFANKMKSNKRTYNLRTSTKNVPSAKISKRKFVKSRISSNQLTLNLRNCGTNHNLLQHPKLPIETFQETAQEKRKQEEADFRFALKLQAQFDSIRLPSQTRRGTKRQNDIRNYLVDKQQ